MRSMVERGDPKRGAWACPCTAGASHRVDRGRTRWAALRPGRCATEEESHVTAPWFMFATGIENSYPTIDNGRKRVDEMEKCGHYKHWRTDFELLQDLDVRVLRNDPPIHTTWLAPELYYWGFADLTFGYLKDIDVAPIV